MNTKTQKALPAPERLEALPRHEPGQDEIALAAYHIWEMRGCPEDDGVAHWLDAEARLRTAWSMIPFEL